MMSLLLCKEAIKLYSITNNHLANAALKRGDAVAIARFRQIAAAAASGRFIVPRPKETQLKELTEAAVFYGLTAPDDFCLGAPRSNEGLPLETFLTV
jgi:hypothetical protein